MSLAPTIEDLRKRIEKVRLSSPLASREVTLLGACKGQPAAMIEEAMTAGIRNFGENRVQEAKEKWERLRQAHPGVQLHLIGPLQTNKVKEALALFDVIQTLDRPKLAETIAKIVASLQSSVSSHTGDWRLRTKSFYIQVNTGKEPQKAGVVPEEADAFIEDCRVRLQLPVNGLMCVPPAGQPPAPHFAFLRALAQRHGLNELSMGMSEDFETAVRMGSTCVRIGRALFGDR